MQAFTLVLSHSQRMQKRWCIHALQLARLKESAVCVNASHSRCSGLQSAKRVLTPDILFTGDRTNRHRANMTEMMHLGALWLK